MKSHFQLSKLVSSLIVVGGVSFVGSQAMAAVTPMAGTNISNVASATYTDSTGTERVVTSNEVKTIVAHVGSFTLEESRQAQATANAKVSFPHILTNTGNATETFTIKIEDLDPTSPPGEDEKIFDFADKSYDVYLDRNKDGVPDNDIPLKNTDKITLTAGESVGLVVIAQTPNDAKDEEVDKLKLTATVSKLDDTTYLNTEAENIDTVFITQGAVIKITKSASLETTIENGKIIDLIKYTLTFKNNGNAVAEKVAVFDVLPDNVEFYDNGDQYKANYSAFGILDKRSTDSDNFVVDDKKVLLNIETLAANTESTLTFYVKVDPTKSSTIKNTAYVDPNGKDIGNDKFDYLKPEDITLDPNTIPKNTDIIPSNPSIINLNRYDGVINDSATDKSHDTSTPDVPNGIDSIALTASVGIPVLFGNSGESEQIYVHNIGNTTDTYNLTLDYEQFDVKFSSGSKKLIDAFPQNATITILQSDRQTPAVDTNGDGVVDTGPIQAGESVQFYVRVTLPDGTVISEDSAGLGFKLVSTSVKTAKKDTLKLIVSAVTAHGVDLYTKVKNDDNTTTDKGIGKSDGKSQDSKTTTPGKPVEFDITIKNSGDSDDNYNIIVPNIPTDWTVEIFEKNDGSCNTDKKVTQSGVITSMGEKSFCVIVTPPTQTSDITREIDVQVLSPKTGANDTIKFEVDVVNRGLSLTSNNEGQIAPGGTVVYTHILTNNGSKPETAADFSLEWTSTLTNGNTSVYFDTNENGKFDEGDKLFTNLGEMIKPDGLESGKSINIFVKVEAPLTAKPGDSDTTILTVKSKGDNAPQDVSVTDYTIVTSGQLRLVKEQAIDKSCSTPVTDLDYSQKAETIKPGQCVSYRIVATNEGSAKVNAVTISDMVPAYTKLNGVVSGTLNPDIEESTVFKKTLDSVAPALSYSVTYLNPGSTATLQFTVKVDETETTPANPETP